jgi:hypothetical protein
MDVQSLTEVFSEQGADLPQTARHDAAHHIDLGGRVEALSEVAWDAIQVCEARRSQLSAQRDHQSTSADAQPL